MIGSLQKKFTTLRWPLVTVAAILLVWLGYFTPRTNFDQLIILFCALFLVYAFLCELFSGAGWKQIFAAGMLLRLVLIAAIPALSDDFYRFLWDGTLVANGINPFATVPREVFVSEAGAQLPYLHTLFGKFNSPDYFSVFPLACQAMFAAAAWLFPHSLLGQVVVLRLLMLATEAGTIYVLWQLLRHFNKPIKLLALYAFNPLVIMEFTGNLHLEGFMMCFLLLSFWLLVKIPDIQNWRFWLAMVFFMLAVNIKLLPLMLLPFVFFSLGLTRGSFFAAGVLLLTFLSYLPFYFPGIWENNWKSISLYFNVFEFNASIYYLVRWLGFQFYGYNIIGWSGPLLSFLRVLLTLLISWRLKKNFTNNFALTALWVWLVYLAFAPVVHPWYVLPLLPFCLLTPYRFPIIWTALLPLTYAAYAAAPYQENWLLLLAEYSVVAGFFAWELWREKVVCEKPIYMLKIN